jgi:hypothetical protein
LFPFGFAASSCDDFALEQLVNVILEFTVGRVAHKDDLAVSVNQEHVRHTSDFVVLISGAAFSSHVVVLNTCPFLVLDVGLQLCPVLIDRHADQTDIFAPVLALLKHFLVVSHRGLARGAPGRPEVEQDNLTLLVLN